ncbi:tetratricopeptide repeat protein [Candidatus Woesearchaeota archaeon]|nr:tetratricopeptide repeat protein [Candidatus Woesearchaeota archaeon]
MVTNHNKNLEFLPKVRNLTLTALIAMLPNLSFGNVQTQTIMPSKAEINYSNRQVQEKDSLTYLFDALKKNPKNLDVLLELGSVEIAIGNCTTAVGFLERAVKVEKSEKTLCALADAYRCAMQYKIAEDVANEALELNQNSVLARKKLGAFAFEQNKLKEAAKYWSDALKFAPNDYVLNINLGGAYLNIGKINLAEKYARKGVKLNKECANGHYVLGLVCEAKGNTKEAIAAIEKAIELNPSADNYKEKLQSLKER